MGESAACGLHCIKMNNIGVKFGREVVLKNVNIHVHCGQLTVIIGRNGARQNYFAKSHFRGNRTYWEHYFYGYEKEYN
jgi:ABC-type transporter Mla maintaining outer membrane lipid asymmetry ATPase subunit MlaF